MFPHGIFRITAASPRVAIANPQANAETVMSIVDSIDTDLVLLPELSLTGYTCGDLFASETLLEGAIEALCHVVQHSANHKAVVIVGLPLVVRDSLMNCAAVVSRGRLCGVVPKSYLPTYREFYEARHFRSGSDADPSHVEICSPVEGRGAPVAFGTDLLFRYGDAVIGVELCEDLWTPIPPSGHAALAGANVLVNLSASNETIGKARWRRDLVASQSGRCIAAYAYASSGADESTSDVVFGGHCMIAENGIILDQSRRIGDGLDPPHVRETSVTCDIDLDRLAHDRRVVGSFDDARTEKHLQYRLIDVAPAQVHSRPLRSTLRRHVDALPFVPKESDELQARCAEIFAIQIAGLVKRFSCLRDDSIFSIGISGGLDSTLALLAAIQACDASGRPRTAIHGLTMPGFGTTKHTRTSADQLIAATGITGECIDIRPLCLDTFRAMNHQPLGIAIDDTTTVEGLQEQLTQVPAGRTDLTFENVQARIRTLLLMSRGFVLGTGDLSEQALGWSTYNGDHMSMYNVNTSIPKTLVRFLVRYAADHFFQGQLSELLHRIADTPISPELMPPAQDGSIQQSTEATLGDYELHDFFMYHFIRNGFGREKILYLAQYAAFTKPYPAETIAETLDLFMRRFFANQFKRNCVPDGPKVGSVSLSPRGDWRMPSDADGSQF